MNERRGTTSVPNAPAPSLLSKGMQTLRHMVDQIMPRNQKPKLLPMQSSVKQHDAALDAPQKLIRKTTPALHYPKTLPAARVRPLPQGLVLGKKRAVPEVATPTLTYPGSLPRLRATAPSPSLPLLAQRGRVFFCKLGR